MKYGLYIDGQWRAAASKAMLPVINPASEALVGQIAAGGEVDVDLAVTAARRAFAGAWSSTSGQQRASYLRAIGKAIDARREELARIEVVDNGKPLAEALWDIADAAACFDYYADLAAELDATQDEPVALPDARFACRARREPAGVAAQIIPWNYPLLMAAWKVAPALAAGCTCVLKPSEHTSLTALELAAIAHDAGLPPGVLNVVTGLGPAVGEPLARHAGVDKIAFTGSVRTGSGIMTLAAQDIKNISLELGGKSAMIVFDDADIDQALEWIMFGIFWNQGQVCSATSRLLVQRSLAAKLTEALVEHARRIRIGDGMEPDVLLGPLINAAQRDKVLDYVAHGRHAGARLLCGPVQPTHLQQGYFVSPTIFDSVTPDMRIWREEIFGPILSIMTFSDEDQALRLANDTRYGLAAAVMSRDPQRCERVARALRAGIVWVNCSQPTFVQAPWGGMKYSGIGRELGRWGLENYLEVKQITSYQVQSPWGWYLKSAGETSTSV